MGADTQVVTSWLEPYRGRRGAMNKELGADGWRALYVHPEVNGSPTRAAEFLGLQTRSYTVASEKWALLGLRVSKADYAEREKQLEGQMLQTMTDEECLSAYLQETSAVEYADVYEWRLPKGAEYGTCVLLGDLHLGSEECDLHKIVDLRDWIAANHDARWACLGDVFNVNTKNSKGGLDSIPFVKARKSARAIFAPIASQCIAFLEGNHDLRPARETGIPVSVCKEMCDELHLPHYSSPSVFMRLRVIAGKQRQEYDGMLHHGFGGGQTPGTKRNYLHRMIANLDTDFFFMGHVHDRIVDDKIIMGLSEDTEFIGGKERVEVCPKERVMGVVGSFQRWLPHSYSREKGMPPASLGSISAHFYGTRHVIHGRK